MLERNYHVGNYKDFLDLYKLASQDGVHSRIVVPSRLGRKIGRSSEDICSEWGLELRFDHCLGGSVINL